MPIATRSETKYDKVLQGLVGDIHAGRYAAGQRLPGERDLAGMFGVSVGTAVRALETLTREGMLTRRRGSGTFVAADRPALTSIVFVAEEPTDVASHSYMGPIFNGLCSLCFEAGIDLGVASVDKSDWVNLPERYPGSAFLFVSLPIGTLPILADLWRKKQCFVVVGSSWGEAAPFPTVDSDNFNGARRAVEYLLRQNHRRIALVNGEPDSANCRDRRSGYEAAMAAWEIPVCSDWIISAGGSMEVQPDARNRFVDLLMARRRPTAVLCAGYFLALDVMDITRQYGVLIPDHLSIVAFDDVRSAQYLDPPLTTVRQPLVEMGRRGAAYLIQLMRNGACAEESREWHKALPVELVLRASCASPAEPADASPAAVAAGALEPSEAWPQSTETNSTNVTCVQTQEGRTTRPIQQSNTPARVIKD